MSADPKSETTADATPITLASLEPALPSTDSTPNVERSTGVVVEEIPAVSAPAAPPPADDGVWGDDAVWGP